MESELWLERWRKNEIGFHQEEFNPYLLRFWSALRVPRGGDVFVPLCGKSRDMVWLRDQGYPVWGVEISTLAVGSFFAEQNMIPVQCAAGPFTLWQADGFNLHSGDFFDITVQHIHAAAAVYDRASLIALPLHLRNRYVKYMTQLLEPGAKILLITLDYPAGQMEGPPFNVDETEVRMLYEPAFEVRPLWTHDALDEAPRFRERGLTRLEEKIYLLVRRH